MIHRGIRIDDEQEISDMDKESVRKTVHARRGQAAPADLIRDAEVIFQKVRSMSEYMIAGTVYLYADFNHEVPTRAFMAQVWQDGKQTALPRIEGDEMVFYLVDSFQQLEKNSMGIPEPKKSCEKAECESAFMIMQGVAFDPSCTRVGYGRGYYDRYLAGHPAHYTVGVAFDFQIFDELPAEEFDFRPQWVITETRRFKKP